ncbi:23S rRNA (guanosine(2251)-2'-O)-methyltransferase RlmB [Desulfurivibrio dismutans]|uniref:23S rRNA (guanosine(2251)-2'-O)-methyltransferase RlmB n=1 Tax=Desulfurivibrio dismutans TaxID=1398908 RepID=UPI0023DA81E8|nr:23S rRNA (guanosine(2251)-2'-O)-methyltransferase RlmB [Desulfurivibrio alkaliphilus]MDF1614516.1 23S rRNA (guanosine(2251)-2'-O)-methyltransferase RlmB [Desulfurivibrio alkaliphilus]
MKKRPPDQTRRPPSADSPSLPGKHPRSARAARPAKPRADQERRPAPHESLPANAAWGFHAVRALLAHRPASIEQLFISAHRNDQRRRELAELARRHGIAVHEELPPAFAQEGISHQGVVAQVKADANTTLENLLTGLAGKSNPLLVALDSIQDPRNLGAIIRTAAAFGADGLIIPKDRSAPLSGTVMKAAAGTLPLVNICQVTNLANTLAELKKHGFWIYGAGGRAPQQLYHTSFSGPVCLVMGNEQKGLRPLVSRHCDHQIAIPMAAGVESLNVAVATGVILSEIRRQQG